MATVMTEDGNFVVDDKVVYITPDRKKVKEMILEAFPECEDTKFDGSIVLPSEIVSLVSEQLRMFSCGFSTSPFDLREKGKPKKFENGMVMLSINPIMFKVL